jgi:type II secretory pathway component PulC
LDNPELSLRTNKSEIKYVDLENPDDRIEIIVKKKNKEDYHIFRKVTLVPYISADKILSKRMPYGKELNHYRLAQSDILYEDLPTIPNSQG